MSKEQLKIERVRKFIKDYDKLLAQPDLSKESKKRAIEDVEALKDILKYAIQHIDRLDQRKIRMQQSKK